MTSEKMSDFPLSLFACESDDKYVIHATSALDAEVISGWSLRGRGALFSHGERRGKGGNRPAYASEKNLFPPAFHG